MLVVGAFSRMRKAVGRLVVLVSFDVAAGGAKRGGELVRPLSCLL